MCTFSSEQVDYLKLDGCYNNKSGFVTGYPAMGAGLQASGNFCNQEIYDRTFSSEIDCV